MTSSSPHTVQSLLHMVFQAAPSLLQKGISRHQGGLNRTKFNESWDEEPLNAPDASYFWIVNECLIKELRATRQDPHQVIDPECSKLFSDSDASANVVCPTVVDDHLPLAGARVVVPKTIFSFYTQQGNDVQLVCTDADAQLREALDAQLSGNDLREEWSQWSFQLNKNGTLKLVPPAGDPLLIIDPIATLTKEIKETYRTGFELGTWVGRLRFPEGLSEPVLFFVFADGRGDTNFSTMIYFWRCAKSIATFHAVRNAYHIFRDRIIQLPIRPTKEHDWLSERMIRQIRRGSELTPRLKAELANFMSQTEPWHVACLADLMELLQQQEAQQLQLRLEYVILRGTNRVDFVLRSDTFHGSVKLVEAEWNEKEKTAVPPLLAINRIVSACETVGLKRLKDCSYTLATDSSSMSVSLQC